MFKIVGICILIFTIYYIFRAMCKREHARISLLTETSRFMHEVRRTISVSMKPLPQICRAYKTDEPYLRSLIGDEFRSVSDVEGELCKVMGSEATRMFVNFISGFGRGYLADEIKRCDIAIKEFDTLVSAERDGANRRLRLFKTLGVASSFALVILFI